MSTTFITGIELTTIDCGKCGGSYAISEEYRDECEDYGTSWNCPYCKCGWGYSKNNRITMLTNELKAKKKQFDSEVVRHNWTKTELKDAENGRRAEKAAKTRIKNRVSNGVCPCCNRTFKQLAAHMKNKHPNWNKSEAPA